MNFHKKTKLLTKIINNKKPEIKIKTPKRDYIKLHSIILIPYLEAQKKVNRHVLILKGTYP